MPRGRIGPEWLRSPPSSRALLVSAATVLVSREPPPGLARGPRCAGAPRARRGGNRTSPPARSDAVSRRMPGAGRRRQQARFGRCGDRRAAPLRIDIARLPRIALLATDPRHGAEIDGAARMESVSRAQPIAQARRRAARPGGGEARDWEGWWPRPTSAPGRFEASPLRVRAVRARPG